MPIRIIVTGLPRSGAALVYKAIQEVVVESPRWVCLYEPLNPWIMRDPSFETEEQKMLGLRNDVYRLGANFQRTLQLNSNWYWRYTPDRHSDFEKIFEEIYAHIDRSEYYVLMMDSYALLFIDRLLQLLPRVRTILITREFSDWVRALSAKQRLASRLRVLLRLHICDADSTGLRPYVLRVLGKEVRKLGKKHLESVHKWVQDLAQRLSGQENVLVLSLELVKTKPHVVAAVLSNFTGVEIAREVLSLVEKI